MVCCNSPSAVPSAVNYNRKSIFWCAATRRVLLITAENKYYGVLQLAECCKSQQQINLLVCCISPNAVNYNGKSQTQSMRGPSLSHGMLCFYQCWHSAKKGHGAYSFFRGHFFGSMRGARQMQKLTCRGHLLPLSSIPIRITQFVDMQPEFSLTR